jgi:hypothetical protein
MTSWEISRREAVTAETHLYQAFLEEPQVKAVSREPVERARKPVLDPLSYEGANSEIAR